MSKSLREISLDEFKSRLANADPILFDIIKALPLKKAHRVFEAGYPYGAYITYNGIFQFPEQENLIDCNIDIRNELNYRNVPLGIIMQKGYEVFRDPNERGVIPRVVAVRGVGLEMGIWEAYSPAPGFSTTAGSRSIFFLPKIADAIHHKRLKKYGVRRHAPHGYFDQWEIFTEMAGHCDFPETWQVDIHYFGKEWFKDIMENPKWYNFKVYLLEKVLKHSLPNRSQVTLDAIWENFRLNLATNHYKVSPDILETLKYLMMIANGDLPGFKVADELVTMFPYRGIVESYVKEYGLDEYAPTMMYPDYFDIEQDTPIYYSLQVPLCPQSLRRDKNSVTTRANLFDLIELLDLLLRDVSAGRLGEFGQIYYDLFSKIEFEFFHSEPDENKGVYSSREMPEDDPKLIANPFGKGKEFAHHSSFVRGCVRIVKKENRLL